MDRANTGIVSAIVVSLGVLAATPATLYAQAWVPPPGEGTVSLTYQTYDVWGHFNVLGQKKQTGGTFSQSMIATVDVGLPGAFAITASLPFIASKYTGPKDGYCVGGPGPFPECPQGHTTFPGDLDDGFYHGAVQDFHLDARRMWVVGGFAVTPYAGVTIPSHEYETVGEAVPGKYRRDYRVGTSVGTALDQLLPRSYAHVRYTYAAAQKIEDRPFPFTRSLIEAEGGWSPIGRLGVRALFSWQIRHHAPSPEDLDDDWRTHDRFIGPSYFIAGGGPSVVVTRAINAYALWVVTPSGNNGAHVARTLSFGMSLGFGGSKSLGGIVERRNTPEPDHVLADAVNGMRQFQ